MVTLLGTSTNLVAAALLEKHDPTQVRRLKPRCTVLLFVSPLHLGVAN
jgi:hypothetical protein